MKDFMAKIDSMFTVMDQREERLLAAMDQRDVKVDERVAILEQSLHTISECLQAMQLSNSVPSSDPVSNLPGSVPSSDPVQTLPKDSSVVVIQRDQTTQHQLHPSLTPSIHVDFPRFQGTDVLNWIYKAETYFHYYQTPNEERVEHASIHFHGPVIPWFQMMRKTETVTNWADLIHALVEDYGPSEFDNPEFTLFKLVQHDWVNSYYQEFMALANRVDDIPTRVLIPCFISGLKKDLQRDIIPLKPTSLPRLLH